ncbi:MAG: crossover junction endodeoxyribonuclease RuvC [Thermodesulfobacteriota bacterium]|nr:crossover junction endodeoxyribonuclease RuvC [Thermodesulfobacteriota bacterium]
MDPGTNATGYGIIRKSGARSTCVASGVIRTSPNSSQSQKLWQVYTKLDEIVQLQRPDVMVVESLFHFKNSQSLIKMSQIRGVILLLGETHGLEIYEYAPMEIKKGITGYGAAVKEQMIFMISKVLGLGDLRSADEADALAIALYHSHICRPGLMNT